MQDCRRALNKWYISFRGQWPAVRAAQIGEILLLRAYTAHIRIAEDAGGCWLPSGWDDVELPGAGEWSAPGLSTFRPRFVSSVIITPWTLGTLAI